MWLIYGTQWRLYELWAFTLCKWGQKPASIERSIETSNPGSGGSFSDKRKSTSAAAGGKRPSRIASPMKKTASGRNIVNTRASAVLGSAPKNAIPAGSAPLAMANSHTTPSAATGAVGRTLATTRASINDMPASSVGVPIPNAGGATAASPATLNDDESGSLAAGTYRSGSIGDGSTADSSQVNIVVDENAAIQGISLQTMGGPPENRPSNNALQLPQAGHHRVSSVPPPPPPQMTPMMGAMMGGTVTLGGQPYS